jgi:hypothetical protein
MFSFMPHAFNQIEHLFGQCEHFSQVEPFKLMVFRFINNIFTYKPNSSFTYRCSLNFNSLFSYLHPTSTCFPTHI